LREVGIRLLHFCDFVHLGKKVINMSKMESR
jgi:hypothetical protein